MRAQVGHYCFTRLILVARARFVGLERLAIRLIILVACHRVLQIRQLLLVVLRHEREHLVKPGDGALLQPRQDRHEAIVVAQRLETTSEGNEV